MSHPLCIMVAVHAEGDLIAGRLRPVSRNPVGVPEVRTGSINGKSVLYCASGMGKTNAAHCLTALMLNFAPSIVIHSGIGGAYASSGLKAGDIAIATKEVYADEGILLEDGFHPLQLIGIPFVKTGGKKYFNEFPLDAGLRKKMLRAAGSAGLKASAGVFATVSTVTGTRQRATELSARLGAICENMEGAAVAHICTLYSVPCVEIRGISNIVETRDTSKWNIPLASENSQLAVLEFLNEFQIS